MSKGGCVAWALAVMLAAGTTLGQDEERGVASREMMSGGGMMGGSRPNERWRKPAYSR